MTRRIATTVLAVTIALLVTPALALAHGEQSQVPFLRASTAVLYDVEFSATELRVGDRFTVTGKVRIMSSWPDHTIGEPEIGFLSLTGPGPVVAIEDRQLSGTFTPQSVRISQGNTYSFEVRAIAREAGRWHIHPSFAIEGVGVLVGHGEWIDVADGDFTKPVTLASGETIELTTYGTGQVITWHLIAFAIGLAWVVFWLARPLVARIPVVAAGGGLSLLSRRDRLVGVGAGAVALATILGGYVVTNLTTEQPLLPLQVVRLEPPALEQPDTLVDSRITEAAWRSAEDALELQVEVTNVSGVDVRLSRLQIAESEVQDHMTVAPSYEVAPDETARLVVTIDGEFLRARNLLPLDDPQLRITALLFFTDAAGNEQVAEVSEQTSPLLPS